MPWVSDEGLAKLGLVRVSSAVLGLGLSARGSDVLDR